MTRPMGSKRSHGRGTFIDSVLEAVDGFYADVMQYLKAWSAAPPRVRAESDGTGAEPVSPALVSTALSSQDGAEVAGEPSSAPSAPAEAADGESDRDAPVDEPVTL